MKTPFVSVIVVNYNGLRFLEDIFSSIGRQSYPRNRFETYLVDNNSDDGSVGFARKNFKWVKVMQTGGNLGFAGACVYAYKKVRGDFVVLLNNDIVLHRDYLKELVKKSVSEDLAIVDSEEYPPGTDLERVKPNRISTINLTSNYIEAGKGFRERRQFSVCGGSCLVRRDKLPEVFDPDYFIYQEDIYLVWNAKLRGKDVRRAEGAKFIHLGFGTVGTNPIFKFYLERNRLTNCFIFYEKGTLLRIFPIIIYEAWVKLLKGLVCNRESLKAFAKAYFWLFKNRRLLMKKRAEIQRKRIVPDREMLKTISYKIFGFERSGPGGKILGVQDAFIRAYLMAVGIRTGDMA